MKTYKKDGVEYISHKDAMKYYDCTATTLLNWREQGRIKVYELPLDSGRLYAVDPELRKSHIGGERFARKSNNNKE